LRTAFYDVEDIEDGSAIADAGLLEIGPEKEQLLSTTESRQTSLRKQFAFRYIPQLLIAVLVASCISLIWILHDCLPANKLISGDSVPPTFHLVKDAVSASSAGVLEDFQAYQSVFTPFGVTDETTTANGVESTTTLAQTAVNSSCLDATFFCIKPWPSLCW